MTLPDTVHTLNLLASSAENGEHGGTSVNPFAAGLGALGVLLLLLWITTRFNRDR
ncbi:hypothetical protein [Streptomyces sp. CNQ085]|uniref:hypothetical protein n=1 Tax=Streptomyces sp. CNQ085 TaxID=2886944 RepID=UPI001F50F83E|nr:hypothetical protein [Streptomyces sp. CNQ085]MCI0383579.1 hypothetical protein [Streptomyces sp. CNQ085]